jgi:hypothetical protein
MRYALLFFVPPAALLLLPRVRCLSHQMGAIRLTGRTGLSLSYPFLVSKERPLPNHCRHHKPPPSFKMALTFRSSVSSSAKGFPRRLPNPPALPQLSTPSTGGVPFQLAEDASLGLLLQCEQFISGTLPLGISILTCPQRVECIT